MNITCQTISFQEAQKYLGVNKQTMYDDIDTGILKYIKSGACKVNTRRRFWIKELDRYLAAKQELN